MSDIITCRGLSKAFYGFFAVQDFDLAVQSGHIHALIGPNGAGKTTVFNLLTGFLRPTRGDILFGGERVTGFSPERLVSRGMVRSFQISAVFNDLSVLDNLRVALLAKAGVFWNGWSGQKGVHRFDEFAERFLEDFGLIDLRDHAAGRLPYGKKRALELATTLARDPKVLLLDEPTQGMGVEDVDLITALIRKAAAGRTVIMVEHNLKVVQSLADRITVLARGRTLTEGSYKEVAHHSGVREAYLGRQGEGS